MKSRRMEFTQGGCKLLPSFSRTPQMDLGRCWSIHTRLFFLHTLTTRICSSVRDTGPRRGLFHSPRTVKYFARTKSKRTWRSASCEETMAANRIIAFFLEDSAQEALIPSLVRRLIAEAGLSTEKFEFLILHSRGGGSLRSFKTFLKDARKRRYLIDLLIVGSDANCKGFSERRNTILKAGRGSPYLDRIIPAIPDPHIERWFMLDMKALSKASQLALQGELPAYKCDKGRYKGLLRDVFQRSGVAPPLGGVEYGPDVAVEMDLYHACKLNSGLDSFVREVRAWLKQIEVS